MYCSAASVQFIKSDLSILIIVLLLFRIFLEIYCRMHALSLELSADLCQVWKITLGMTENDLVTAEKEAHILMN